MFLLLEDGDFYLVPGIGGALALLPTLFGGRINLAEVLEYFGD